MNELNYAEWIYSVPGYDGAVWFVGYGDIDETPSTSSMLIFAGYDN